MYREHRISLVIPARNEERLIGPTLDKVPDLFDAVYVVDDASPDGQAEVVRERAAADPRITLLCHETPTGPGGAIVTGYRRALAEGSDIAVVVGGDDQMDLSEVKRFLDPLVDGHADYVKGNRFDLARLEDTLDRMPRIRLLGNWIITALTKLASGYYKIIDVVDGYTAINRRALATIDWNRAWKGYGYPMDFLVRMNAYGFRCLEVPRTAIYLPGERQSQIKGLRYALRVTPMLIRSFLWRMKFKYLYLDFHPLVLFLLLGGLLTAGGLGAGLWLVADKFFLDGHAVTAPRAILVALLLLSGLQLLLFAMFFDMEAERGRGLCPVCGEGVARSAPGRFVAETSFRAGRPTSSAESRPRH